MLWCRKRDIEEIMKEIILSRIFCNLSNLIVTQIPLGILLVITFLIFKELMYGINNFSFLYLFTNVITLNIMKVVTQ